jgi:lysophospholipase L1-like esterase
MGRAGIVAERKGPRVAVAASLAVAAALLAGCSGSGSSPDETTEHAASTTSPPTPEYVDTDSPFPDSVAVLGHSGATGYNSDPVRRNADAPQNSWATGDNPAVRSIAARVVAENPAAAGRITNLAVNGSRVDGLLEQADAIVAAEDVPELILIQTIENDIRCDGTDPDSYEPFAAALGEVLELLEAGAPDSRVVIVSPSGTVAGRAEAVYPVSPTALTAPGPCGLVDPATNALDPARIAGLQAIVDEYQARVDRECGDRSNCETDGGAARALPGSIDLLASDFNHLSIAGHAELARLVWAAIHPDSA